MARGLTVAEEGALERPLPSLTNTSIQHTNQQDQQEIQGPRGVPDLTMQMVGD